MRLATAASALLLAACATLGGGGRDSVEFTVPVFPDTAMGVAAAELEARGYAVSMMERGTLVTRPRAIPRDAGSLANGPTRDWIIRVEASAVAFTGDTQIRVTGFLMPEAPPRVPGDTAATTPVTADNRALFGQLELIGRWISEAARRHRSGR